MPLALKRSLTRRALGWGLRVLGVLVVCLWVWVGFPLAVTHTVEYWEYGSLLGTQTSAGLAALRHQRQAITGWFHDDSHWEGMAGTKRDVQCILNAKKNKPFGGCSSGHPDLALELITNQNPGTSWEAWNHWWEAHQHQTQAEWMSEGFRQNHLDLTIPLNHDECIQALTLIGRNAHERDKWWTKTAENSKVSLPRYIIFNLRRALLHSDFDEKSVTREEIARDESNHLLTGLLTFIEHRNYMRHAIDPFDPENESQPASIPYFMNPLTPWIYNLIGLALWLLGSWILKKSRLSGTTHELVRSSPTLSHPP